MLEVTIQISVQFDCAKLKEHTYVNVEGKNSETERLRVAVAHSIIRIHIRFDK